MALTALKVKNAKAGRHVDGRGLCLLVKDSGARTWVLRMQKDGRRRDYGLGSVAELSLADARDAAASGQFGLEAVNEMREAQKLGTVISYALFGALLLGIEAGLLLAYLLLRSTRQRITKIADVANEVGRGNLSQRLDVNTADGPFERLSSELNAMFAKLEELVWEMRTITDAIAHDIRTPLMRMRMRAECALASTSIRDARPMLEMVLNESETAIRITSLALEISRAEAGIDKSGFVGVDFVSLVRDIIEAYEPVAVSLGIKLSFDHSPSLEVYGHPQLLGQAITNLIDNVFRHAAAGRVCELRVDQVSGYTRLQVSDRGTGIPNTDRLLAVRRFAKLSPSRASEGAGLGLALVDAVARLHGGQLNLEDNEPGLRVVMVLPSLQSR